MKAPVCCDGLVPLEERQLSFNWLARWNWLNALRRIILQCISVHDSLNIFKLARRYTRIWWIKESGKERDNDETGERPFPAESAEPETRTHGDAFSTSAVKASRQTCSAVTMFVSYSLR
jgi:hypothetical protein